MNERHVWRFFGHGFEGQSDDRAGVAAALEHGFDIPALEVGHVYLAFFAAGEYGDDAAEGGGALNVGE